MASEGVELAIAGVQLVQKIFQDKVLIDHGWSELSDLKTEVGHKFAE